MTKHEGAPVHIVGGDDPMAAFAVREVDLQNRFKYSASQIAKLVGLTGPNGRPEEAFRPRRRP